MSPMPLAEMNECCKVVATIKDRDLERAKAEYAAVNTELADRVIELEQHAFEKGKLVSSLEGEIAYLKNQIALLVPATIKPTLKYAPSQPGKCVICSKECISRCPECKAVVCDKQTCGQAHGHGAMYGQS